MDAMTSAAAGADRAVRFTGSWREYLPIAATNVLLTIVTLGVYRFWATARQRRYLWSRTEVIGDRLEWSGTGKEMFIGFLMVMAPDSAEVMFEAGHIAEAAGENAQARDYWSKALNADPNGPAGKAAREALAMSDAPLTVTNEVAKRPFGDGEGQDRH